MMMTSPAIGPADWFVTEAKIRSASARCALKRAWRNGLAALFWVSVMVHVGDWLQYTAFALAAICGYRTITFLYGAWLDAYAAKIAAGFIPASKGEEGRVCYACRIHNRSNDC